MVKPLGDTLTQKVYAEMREGYALAKEKKWSDAEKCFLRAWQIIPEPKYDWDISQITTIRFAKFYRDAKKFPQALEWALATSKCCVNEGDAGPSIIMGSIYFESGDRDKAYEYFEKAFSIAGKRGFEGEDPKYLKFFQQTSKKK